MLEAFSEQEVEIIALLRQLLAGMLEIDIGDVAADADLTNGLCVESLQQLELMTRVEERLHMTFDADAWVASGTVADLAQHIATKQENHHDG